MNRWGNSRGQCAYGKKVSTSLFLKEMYIKSTRYNFTRCQWENFFRYDSKCWLGYAATILTFAEKCKLHVRLQKTIDISPFPIWHTYIWQHNCNTSHNICILRDMYKNIQGGKKKWKSHKISIQRSLAELWYLGTGGRGEWGFEGGRSL